MNTYRAVLIAGPTASGKSAFAIDLAKTLNGEIINADSMQLYREMRIVSARPSVQDEAEAPHHLYGVLPASHACSTGEWLELAKAALDDVAGRDKLPILIGGTGLYFKALTEGFAKVPEIPHEVRAQCRELAEEQGLAGVREALAVIDPQAAEIFNDLQRLTRALEVVSATGRSLLSYQEEAQSAPLLTPEACVRLVLAPPRDWLHRRIAMRSELMLTDDGISEIRALQEQALPTSLPAMRAIGVKEVGAFLDGALSHEETVEKLTIATRQYAKRQETWFRNQMGNWLRLDPSKGQLLEDLKQVVPELF